MKRRRDVVTTHASQMQIQNDDTEAGSNDTSLEAGPSKQHQGNDHQFTRRRTNDDSQAITSIQDDAIEDLDGQVTTTRDKAGLYDQDNADIQEELNRRFTEIRAKRRELEAEVERVSIEKMVLMTLARDIDARISSLQDGTIDRIAHTSTPNS